MLLYPVLHMLVFTLYINFDTIALCFQRFNFSTGQTEFSGLYWFKRFFEELGQSYCAAPFLHQLPLVHPGHQLYSAAPVHSRGVLPV